MGPIPARGKITNEKKIQKLPNIAPLIVVPFASENNELNYFDGTLRPGSVSSY